MNLKDMLAKMSQLSEATEKTKTGIKHTAEPGGYGRKDDEDEEGNKVKSDAPKKGRGRPKKDADASGEVKSYDTKSLGSVFGGGTAPKKPIGTVSKKHSLKEYFDSLDEALSEAEQIQIKPASQMPKKPGQTSMPGQQQQMAGQSAQNTQVIAQGDKTLGTVNNPQLAQQIKQSIGKGEMTLMPDESMEEGFSDVAKKVGSAVKAAGDKVLDKLGHGSDEDLIRDLQKKAGLPQTGKKPEQQVNEKDIGKHNNATTGFDALVKKLTPKYGVETAKKIAGAQMKKIKEAEMPSDDSDMGAGLGAGRSQGVLEGRAKADNKAEKAGKKVTKDLEYDMGHKGKNDLKKKKVKEGMDHRLQAARLEGKSHGLRKESYNCRYDDMEEARMYHEGFKEGLDECYGQSEMGKVLAPASSSIRATVPGMASQAMEDDVMEVGRGEYMKQQAKSTPGDTFKAFGQTFKDKEVTESPFAFEALEQQLNALLEGKETVSEGLSVSISKGQQGAPDSVSVTAQDGEADQLLALLKQAGMGLFGGEEQAQPGRPMTVDTQGGEEAVADIAVVNDHDGMMDLIKKVTGDAPQAPTIGFGDEEGHVHDHEHEHTDEETCNECGMMECDCDTMQEGEDEIGGPDDETQEEYMDQAEEEVAEDQEVVNNDDEANEENSDAVRDAALAQAADDNEKQVDEGEYANSDDDAFAADIDFMTNVITAGINGKKSTGQTTIPVIAGQENRMTANESIVADWKKLAGIK